MITRTQPTNIRRWVILFLAAFVAVLATMLAAVTASAAPSPGAETRVRASTATTQTIVGVLQQETAGQQLGTNVAGHRIVVATGVAANGARGISGLGGHIAEEGVNGAGGRLITSVGPISQNDFAPFVERAMIRGDSVEILTGAHGLPNGTMTADASMLADDVARFGDWPDVTIHDVTSMSPSEIRSVLNGPGTIIGGFCDSAACLGAFK